MWRQEDVLVDAVTSAIAANWTWTNVRAIFTDATSPPPASTCPVGTIAAANPGTEALFTIALRVRSVSTSTSAMIKRSREGTRVTQAPSVLTLKVDMSVSVHPRRTITLWRSAGSVSAR